MALQVEYILERDRREHLDNLSVDSSKEMPVSAELGLFAIPYWKLSHDFEIVD
jgi:hypothetical protein